jgi:hypothetical protein
LDFENQELLWISRFMIRIPGKALVR